MADNIPDWARDTSNRAPSVTTNNVPDWARDTRPASTQTAKPKGTPTDWLPDAIQGSVERLGLQLGIIDPSTYYGTGNYGPGARPPKGPDVVRNTPVPSWAQRVARSTGESFSTAGSSVSAILKRAGNGVADDDAIRHYASAHNWSKGQLDSALAQAIWQRGEEEKRQKAQWAIRDADEARREDGGAPTIAGRIKRGSADLVGLQLADAPLLAASLESKLASAGTMLLGRATPILAPLAEKIAPTVGRMAGQGLVQAGADVLEQAEGVNNNLQDHYDPMQTIVRGALGAGFQGGMEVLGKTSSKLSKWIVTKLKEPSALDRLASEGINPSELPEGVSVKDAAKAVKQLKTIRDEAANFRGTTNPRPQDVFPVNRVRPSDAERWGKSLGADEFMAGRTPAPVETPSPEPYVHDIAPNPVHDTLAEDEAVLRQHGLTVNHFNSVEDAKAAAGLLRGREPVEPVSYDGPVRTPEPVNTDPTISKKKAESLLSNSGFENSLERDAQAFIKERGRGNTETPNPAVNNRAADQAGHPNNTEAPINSGDDVVVRMTNALKSAGRAREEQEALYTAERKARVAAANRAMEEGQGEEALNNAMGHLSGEFPKADFESVAHQFSPDDIGHLTEKIRSSENLTLYGKATAYTGFKKLMKGVVPARSELDALSKVYPPEFIKAALSKRKTLAKTADIVEDLWHLPKSLMSSVDLSAPLRQGVGLAHRGEFWKSLAPMLKAVPSQKAFDDLLRAIKTHPDYAAAESAGLGISERNGSEAVRESFQSHIAERLPHVKMSERSYNAFLDKLRFDTFSALKKEAEKIGHDVSVGSDANKAIANYINVVTGRGGLGKYESASRLINAALFSGRFVSSRLQILTAPVLAPFGKGFIGQLPKGLRKEAAKSYASIASAYALTTGLAVAMGAAVTTDPYSSDFGKAVAGNSRMDSGDGFLQYIVAGAHATQRKATSLKTGTTHDLVRQGDTPYDSDMKFIFNKLHPSLTLIFEQQKGRDSTGAPFEWGKALLTRIKPMAPDDIIATLKEHPNNLGMYYAVLGVLGESVQNFDAHNPNRNQPVVVDDPGNIPTPDWAK